MGMWGTYIPLGLFLWKKKKKTTPHSKIILFPLEWKDVYELWPFSQKAKSLLSIFLWNSHISSMRPVRWIMWKHTDGALPWTTAAGNSKAQRTPHWLAPISCLKTLLWRLCRQTWNRSNKMRLVPWSHHHFGLFELIQRTGSLSKAIFRSLC